MYPISRFLCVRCSSTIQSSGIEERSRGPDKVVLCVLTSSSIFIVDLHEPAHDSDAWRVGKALGFTIPLEPVPNLLPHPYREYRICDVEPEAWQTPNRANPLTLGMYYVMHTYRKGIDLHRACRKRLVGGFPSLEVFVFRPESHFTPDHRCN